MTITDTRTAEQFATAHGMIETGSDSWEGKAGLYDDGYSFAGTMQDGGYPWLTEAEGWPYRILFRGEDFLLWYVEGDLRLKRYGLQTESGIDLETALRMYDRADLSDLTEAERLEVIMQEDSRGTEETRGIIAAWADHNGGKWEGGPDWDDYAAAIIPIKYEYEAEEYFSDQLYEENKTFLDSLPDWVVIDYPAMIRDQYRAIQHGEIWFDSNRLDGSGC